ncbi:MAG: 50S ribosomal protein L32 [Elusimicrobiota bacterium]
MPNPKKKHTPSRRNMRRAANWRVQAQNSSKCPQCGAPKLPHKVCGACGFYNGELVIPRKEKKKTGEGKK